jgi:hypothetical protein
MKIAVLHDVTPCNLVNSYERLGRISCRYLQGNRPFLVCYILELCQQVSTFRCDVLSPSSGHKTERPLECDVLHTYQVSKNVLTSL